MSRQPTTAHPLCACKPHQHGDGHCIGGGLVYQQPDGSRYPGECRILGSPVLPSARAACPLHGPVTPNPTEQR